MFVNRVQIKLLTLSGCDKLRFNHSTTCCPSPLGMQSIECYEDLTYPTTHFPC